MIGAGILRGFFGRKLWRDENFDLLTATTPGNNNLPTKVYPPGVGIPYPGFPATVITEFPGHKEYNHDALTGAGKAEIRPHLHFACTTAAAGDIKWFFEYRIAHGSSVQSGTVSVVVAAGGVAWVEQKVEIGQILLDAGVADIGAQIGFRFYRSPADPPDTYPDTVIVNGTAGWHYPLNSAGSRGIFTK